MLSNYPPHGWGGDWGFTQTQLQALRCCQILAMDSGVATPIMIFGVTYYLELHNPVSIYCISHILPTKMNLVVWTI